MTQSATVPLYLNNDSGIPPYLQISRQMENALRMGMFQPGDQLPTVKEVVANVAINPNTVLKAYGELKRQGLVEGRQGVGTFVQHLPAKPPPVVYALLSRALSRWTERARIEGVSNTALEALMYTALQNHNERRQE
jgi:GntR family transcriptional regulator